MCYNYNVEELPEVYKPESVAQSIIPYPYDDNRAKYLGYRASGFTSKEAIKLLGLTGPALSNWRRDLEFTVLESRLPELRKQLAREYASLEFLRTFRLVSKKDAEVIGKSLDKDKEGNPIPLTKQEHEYLLKMRSYYTPQQLQALEVLISGEAQEGFNFTSIVKELGRSGKLRLRAKREQIEVSSETDNS